MRVISPSSGEYQAVELPYLWDRARPGESGVVEFIFDFEIPDLVAQPYGLLAAKMATGYEITLNGQLIERFGALEGVARGESKLPRLIALGYTIQPGHNELRVRLRGDSGRQAGLSRLVLAPMDQAKAAYADVWLWRVPARFGVVVFSALVGLVGLALWFTQVQTAPQELAKRERLYWYGGVAEMFWVFRVSDSIIEQPLLPLVWWSVLSSLALGGWACMTMLFCMELVGWRDSVGSRQWRTALMLLMLAGAACATAAWLWMVPAALTLWYALLGVCVVGFCARFGYHSLFVSKSLPSRVMTAAILVNVMVGLLDLLVLRIRPSVVGSSALYFSSVLFGMSAAVVVLMRFREVTAQSEQLRANLAERVHHKERELIQTYEQVSKMEREQARAAERTRILRDMHDGVGMHLNVALRQLRTGQADSGAVAQVLQEGLDQLKLSIDALNIPRGDLTALLASVRYRLEPRLRAAHIALMWQVEDLPVLGGLDDKAMRHLQYVVYEAISNAMQHAQASQLMLAACVRGTAVALGISDNGHGFDGAKVPLRGLQAMRERVAAIGGTLNLHSTAQGTTVEVLLPLR